VVNNELVTAQAVAVRTLGGLSSPPHKGKEHY